MNERRFQEQRFQPGACTRWHYIHEQTDQGDARALIKVIENRQD
jgi:hypothetical protein